MTTRRLRRRASALAGLCLPVCVPALAVAQTAPSVTTPASTAADTHSASTATQPSQSANGGAAPVARLQNIIVTAARSPQPRADVLGDVTVIPSSTLQKAGQSSLAQVLAQVPGVQYADYGGPQTSTSLFLRGADSDQTLVLLDGIRINNATVGTASINAVFPESIDHVEIVRGPASSLYGADAMGGVINLITLPQTDKPLEAWANTGFGTYGTSRYSAGLSGTDDKWSYSFSSGYAQSSGYNSTNRKNTYSYNPDKDSYYENFAQASAGYTWKPGQKITAQFYQSRVNGGYDNGSQYSDYAEPDFNDRSIQKLQVFSLTSTNAITDWWTSILRAGSTLDDDLSVNAPGDLYYGNTASGKSTFRTRQNEYTWQNDFQVTPNQKISLAYEHVDQRVDGTIGTYDDDFDETFGNFDQTRRDTNSYTAVYHGDLGRNHLQGSLRDDNDSQYGNHVTGSLAYGFDLTQHLRATVSAGTGFRAPTFDELYYPGYANPNLKPEKSRNAEAGLKYTNDGTELGVTAYKQKVDDLIEDNDDYVPVNVDRATLQGVTLTAGQRFGATSVHASMDFANPKNDDTGEQLALRAKRIFHLSADHTFGRFQLGGEYTLSSDRIDSSGARLGGYGLFNAVASYKLTHNVTVSLRWNNVFDKQYTLIEGYNTAGSNAFVNVAWRM